MQKTKELKGYRKHLSRMVISAMFLALAIVVNLFSEISIPLFGADGMQVKFGGLFTAFPAFLFGPWYGGVVCALSDIIGTLIKPLGAYVPWFTVTAFLAGFLKGLIFMLIKNRDVKWLKAVLAVLVAVAAIFGIFNFVSFRNDGLLEGIYASSESMPTPQDVVDNDEKYSAPTKFAVGYTFDQWERASLPEIKDGQTQEEYQANLARYDTIKDGETERIILSRDKAGKNQFGSTLALTINVFAPALILFAILGAILVGFMFTVDHKYQLGGFASKIFLSVIVAELIQTSINTALLMNLYGVTYQNFSYAVLNTFRVVEGIFMSMVLSYFIYLLYQVYESKIKGKLNII